MKHKLITPDIREIKTGTPAIKIGDKYFVGGIGGNFIPGGLKEEQVTLGMLDENLNFQKLSFSGTEPSNDGKAVVINEYNTWKGTLPLPESGGSSTTEYYKCASVDTENKTWTGYKAVLTDGVYSFENTETTGLTYGERYTPAVGNVYDADCNVKCSLRCELPDNGLIFLFDTNSEFNPPKGTGTAKTGHSIQYGAFSVYGGCSNGETCIFSSSGMETVSAMTNLPSGDADRTICCKVKLNSNDNGRYCLMAYGTDSANKLYAMELRENKLAICGAADAANEASGNTVLDTSQWHSLAIVHKDSVDYFYVDGKADGSFAYARNTTANVRLQLGVGPYSVSKMSGAVTYWAVYDRALTEEEIKRITDI